MKKITKSEFMTGYNCPKSLFLLRQPKRIIEPSANNSENQNQGMEVELFARKLFPGGLDISGEEIMSTYELVARSTFALLKNVPIIYGCSFTTKRGFCKTDILLKTGNELHVFEVKSTCEVKDEHIIDCAFQRKVITESGWNVASISVIHLNREYVRNGDLDLGQLFIVEDVTKQAIEMEPIVEAHLNLLNKMLESGTCPDTDIGIYCDQSYGPCEFKGQCWKQIPETSIFNIGGLRKKVKFRSYQNGIIRMEDIPDAMKLSAKQWIQVRCTRSNEPYFDAAAIRSFLNSIRYPVCYLDFETFHSAIPLFDSQRPYMQTVFQFSSHHQNKQNDTLTHKEFLALPGDDPRRMFTEKLLEKTEGVETIIVYNSAFEITRLKELAEIFPYLREKIQDRIDRIVDLMVPFRNGSFYHPKMNGSYSIKKVLPALVPNFSYDELVIKDGEESSKAYASLLKMSGRERHMTMCNLLLYCEMDTLAMVRILEVLYAQVENQNKVQQLNLQK